MGFLIDQLEILKAIISVISYQLSVGKLSVIRCEFSVTGYQLPDVSFQLPVISYQLSDLSFKF